jgi:eukaryotic-like serine/threonine-protein kinase
MTVKQSLIDAACSVLSATEVAPLKEGSQKTVRLVRTDCGLRVLKVIQVGSTDQQAMVRAAREVDLLKSIDSEFVVRVESPLVELGSPVEGAAWIEEYLEGDDLSEAVCQPWLWPETADMALQISTGLAELHSRRVVHRDLSPNNVRRLSAGGYKIMDPGFARHELLPPITVFGHPGTPGFMSPEHLRPLPAGPTAFSDVFSLGCLMWLTLVGEPPIPFLGDVADYSKRLSAGVLNMSTLISSLQPARHAFLIKCLHPQPARRFRNGAEAAEQLRKMV